MKNYILILTVSILGISVMTNCSKKSPNNLPREYEKEIRSISVDVLNSLGKDVENYSLDSTNVRIDTITNREFVQMLKYDFLLGLDSYTNIEAAEIRYKEFYKTTINKLSNNPDSIYSIVMVLYLDNKNDPKIFENFKISITNGDVERVFLDMTANWEDTERNWFLNFAQRIEIRNIDNETVFWTFDKELKQTISKVKDRDFTQYPTILKLTGPIDEFLK